MRKGFTLVEMLVVIGIIAVLVSASIGGYSAMARSADKARAEELVRETATALTGLFQKDGVWPKRLALNGAGTGKLDKETAYALASVKYLSLSTKNGQLSGYDRFGLLTPWGLMTLKRLGDAATTGSKVTGSQGTIDDHILRYALDLDGDGIIENVNVGGTPINVRATAIVWCCGKDGVIGPYPYAPGAKMTKVAQDDIYSWTPGQTRNVK